jgi:hypothetical protein
MLFSCFPQYFHFVIIQHYLHEIIIDVIDRFDKSYSIKEDNDSFIIILLVIIDYVEHSLDIFFEKIFGQE